MQKYLTRKNLIYAVPTVFAVLLIAVSRLLPHPWNFTPVCAAAVFGGIYLNRKLAIMLPIFSMFIADLFIGISWPDLPFVYGSLILAAFVGGWVNRDRNKFSKFTVRTYAGTLASSVVFFLVTNFGSWLTLSMYTKDIGGLTTAYLMGLPFFKSALAGDLIFITVFVAAYEILYGFTAGKLKTVAA